MLELIRVTKANGRFGDLEAQWKREIISLLEGDDPDDYYPTLMGHAAKIASEFPEDPRYGIFSLVRGSDSESMSYEGLIHINHKLPNTSRATVRMVWNLLAPRHDYHQPDLIAELMASYLIGGVQLCRTAMRSTSLQMYLHNGTDRRYAMGAVAALRKTHPEIAIDVRGTWLHVDGINATPAQGMEL